MRRFQEMDNLMKDNLMKVGLDFILRNYKVKIEDVETIEKADDILFNFTDNKGELISLEFYYDKEGKPKYSIVEKETKPPTPPAPKKPIFDFENNKKDIDKYSVPVDIFGDGNKPSPPKEPQAPKQAPKEPKKFTGNEQVKNFIEGLEKDIEGLEIENEELKKGDKKLISKLEDENKDLKKEIDKLKSQIKLNADASTDLADYVKMKQNQYKKTVTPEQIELIKKLIQEGKTEREIVKLSKTSNGTVHRVKTGQI